MERIVLTHLSGSKASREDVFPLDQFKEIVLGRDPSSTVRFSDEVEMMVGRHHARITRNPALPYLFLITDLDSRNGTFVNQQRIFGAASLNPGDVVQCGLGGPVFKFGVEPETDRLREPQRPLAKPDIPVAASAGVAIDSSDATGVELSKPSPAGPSRMAFVIGLWALMGLAALAAGFFFYRGFRSSGSPAIEIPVSSPQPDSPPSVQPSLEAGENASAVDSGEVEKDAQPIPSVSPTVSPAKPAIKPTPAAPRKNTTSSRNKTTSAAGGKKATASKSSGKAAASGKKEKKAKKEKKVKY
jgi:pSer/pThr/pTyr-binding forkhead associated (FHA) protein